MKGKWSPGKITALVIGGIAAGMFLLVAFYISVAQLMAGMQYLKLIESINTDRERRKEEYRDESGGRYDGDSDDYGESGSSSGAKPYAADGSDATPFSEDDSQEYPEDGQEDSEFYDFHNAIRNDLSYQVGFEDYADMFGSDNVLLDMSYPVVSGRDDGEDMTGVNRAIRREFEEVREYVSSLVGEVEEDVSFYFEGESYVTYMDEDVLSIVYVEYGYLDAEFYESYVVSVNIDMESKMALTNTQILNIDDDFSVEFRNRSERQNGEVSYLYSFTDQEITDLLTEEESLIIFYTPLGMEVGFNYYYGNGWVTVTYKDYEKYLRRF